MGPLFSLILIPFEGYYFVRNLQFIGISKYSLLFFGMYLSFIPNIFLIIYERINYETKFSIDSHAEIFYSLILLFTHCIIAGLRYSFFKSKKLKKLYEKDATYIIKQSVINGWREVDKETLDIEIIDSLVRCETEVEMFKFSLISDITRHWFKVFCIDDFHRKEKLDIRKYRNESKNKLYENLLAKTLEEDTHIDMRNFSRLKPIFNKIRIEKIEKKTRQKNFKNQINPIKNSNTESSTNEINKRSYRTVIKSIANSLKQLSENRIKYPLPKEQLPYDQRFPDLDMIKFYFPGILLCREILYNSRIKSSNLFSIIMKTLCILHSLSPYIIKYFSRKKNYFIWFYWISVPIKIFIISYLLTTLMLFIESGTIDYKRRLISMKSLSSMIIPEKTLLKPTYKIIPTINFYDANTLKSWMTCRRLLMDVGLSYQKRIEAYTGTVLVIYSVIVTILLLGNFGIFKGFNFSDYPIFFMLGYSQALVLGMVIYRIILLGVELNEMHEKHISELLYIKSSFKYMLSNWEIFLDMTNYANSYLHKTKEIYYAFKDYDGTNNRDNLKAPNIALNDEDFKNNLQNICETIDQIVDEIEQENIKNPVKMLGLKIDSNFLRDFYIAAITIFYSLFQYIVNTYVLSS